MSLINQMLQDLDARRAAHGSGVGLHNDVRPLPRAPAARWPLTVVAALVLLSAALAYLWYVREPAAMVGGRAPVLPIAASDAEQSVPATTAPPVESRSAGALPLGTSPSGPLPPVTLEGVAVSLRLTDKVAPVAQPASEARPKPVPAAERVSQAPKEPVKARAPDPVQASTTKPAEQALNERTGRPAGDRPAASNTKTAVVEPAPAVPSAPVVEKATRPPIIERTTAAVLPRERAEVEYRRALSAVNQGNAGEAQERLHEALRQDGLHVAARQLLVKLLLEGKQTEDGMRVLREGVAGQPAQIGWAMSLARLQVDQGDLAGAWKTLDFSRPAAAKNPDYLGFAAHVLQRLGRQQEAAEQYLQATRLAPADGRWWLGLGLSLDALGRTAEAREALLRARQSGNLAPELLSLIEQKLR